MTANVIPLNNPDRDPSSPARPTPRSAKLGATAAVYTVAEVAELLSLSIGSTYTLIRNGEIPAKKMGGRWVVPKRRFHAWLDELPEATLEEVEQELNKLGTIHAPTNGRPARIDPPRAGNFTEDMAAIRSAIRANAPNLSPEAINDIACTLYNIRNPQSLSRRGA